MRDASTSALRALGERLAREQDELLARLPRPTRLRLIPPRPHVASSRPLSVRLFAFAAVLLVLGFGGVFLARPRPLGVTVGGEPGVPGRWIAAVSDAPVPIGFSDGTEVILAPRGRARVLEVTPHGAHLTLESGKAEVHVTPRPGAAWTVSAGPYTVEVKGTRFEIAWSPDDQLFTLALTEGKVAISGCALGSSRMMLAGETLRASCRDNEFRIVRQLQGEADGEPSATPPALAQAEAPAAVPGNTGRPSLRSAPVPRAARTSGETWQSLARASKFRESFELAKERGFGVELERADPQDLLLLGDAARLSGSPDYALRAYEKVRARVPGTSWASNAAFAMGRVYFDQMDAFAEAARWFATYSSEQSDGPLAREALGRRMEALSKAGDHSGAARVADEYVRRYPKDPMRLWRGRSRRKATRHPRTAPLALALALALFLFGAEARGQGFVLRVRSSRTALDERLAAELATLGLSVREVDAVDPTMSLEDLARLHGASAAVRVLDPDTAVEVWAVGRAPGSRPIHEWVPVDPRRGPNVAAVAALEILRAELIEVQVRPAPPPPETPHVDPRAAERPVSASGEAHSGHARLWVYAAGGAGVSPGGLGLSSELLAEARLELPPTFDVAIFGVFGPSRAQVSGPEGVAHVRHEIAGMTADIYARARAFTASVGLGGVVAVLSMTGDPASATYAGQDASVVTVGPWLRACASFQVVPALAVRAQLGVGASVPRPVIRFAGREAATWGEPFGLLTLGLELRALE